MKLYKIQNRSQKNSHSCVPLRAFTKKTLRRSFPKGPWKTQNKAACSVHVLEQSKTGCNPNLSQERLQRALEGCIASRWKLKVIL